MPELPEVETTKTSLAPILGQQVDKVQVFQPKLRWQMPDDLSALVGYALCSVERRAKYLILTFLPNTQLTNKKDVAVRETETIEQSITALQRQLIMHLGMSGSLQQYPIDTAKRKHDHLIITFNDNAGKQTQLHYHDPRRFGAVLWHVDYSAKLLDHLGPEPLSSKFDADYLYHLIQRTADNIQRSEHEAISSTSTSKKIAKRPIARAIKSVIMEQQVVVGVGNIYATESLYLAGIHPGTPAHQLSYKQIVILVDLIKTILSKAIELGGSTLRDFTVA
ncbi:MAG: bifunctional DNA-formamidopyrimidine glycosylase/DNA-(apurinic or apyrimidinic site) lyase, partial [Psychrobacter sp.]|nr:bifunctional DNA-formamidopyrimidine glycosylase/DNA-(apurinic or apyrimidinic site) lyase [Psychrobacter sp.]